MAERICIISGKGGSGKTSLAFSFAKALTNIKQKVLLIDCDISTHGATFFAKSHIEEYRTAHQQILSVNDILSSPGFPPFGFTNSMIKVNEEKKHENFVTIDTNMYFLPSDISISIKQKNTDQYYSIFSDFIKKEIDGDHSFNFDVIIFDCQAGYSELTREIVTLCDVCLLVSEPEAVSAAANKALCFQMGIELENVKTYQIFNKITEEESEYYSKVAASAFFTNLPPVLFNWKVRKTLALSQIPSIDNIDFSYGKNIINILSVILPKCKKNLEEYLNKLTREYHNVISDQIEYLKNQKNLLTKSMSSKKILNTLLVTSFLSIILIFLMLMLFTNDIHYNSNYILSILSLSIAFINTTLYFTNSNKIEKSNKQVNNCDEEIEELQNILKSIKTDDYFT